MLLNPPIKQNIVCLQLSNESTTDPIVSLFSLNEFTDLRSLKLIDLNDRNFQQIPKSKNPVRKLPVPGNSGDLVEAVFLPKMFRAFSDDFRPVPAGKHTNLTGIHRKKSGQCPVGILFPCSSDFWCFSAGSSGRNHRPG